MHRQVLQDSWQTPAVHIGQTTLRNLDGTQHIRQGKWGKYLSSN